MLTDATELSPQEQETARFRLGELADRFTVDGTLRTAPWQAVYRRTWRHPYVPCYYPELGAGPLVSAADERQRARWLAAVYSNETLITKVIRVPSRRGGSYPKFTSSSTLPSLILTMLEALEVTDGHRVLEIGTGSGYNAALLCERLGSEYVTSVDIDPELVTLARERLAANGYTPTLAVVDGADGYPQRAPYDRIIATCSVPVIPPAWLAQAAPGAIIMADVRGLLGGTVVRLRMNDDGVATGRFLPGYASFMPLRPAVDTFPSPPPRLNLAEGAVDSVSHLDPKLLRWDTHVGFVTQWQTAASWSDSPARADCGTASRKPTSSGNTPAAPTTTDSASPRTPPNNTSGTTTPTAHTAGDSPPRRAGQTGGGRPPAGLNWRAPADTDRGPGQPECRPRVASGLGRCSSAVSRWGEVSEAGRVAEDTRGLGDFLGEHERLAQSHFTVR